MRPPSVAFLTYFTYFTLYSTSHHREKSAQPRETEADEHGYDKKTHHIDYLMLHYVTSNVRAPDISPPPEPYVWFFLRARKDYYYFVLLCVCASVASTVVRLCVARELDGSSTALGVGPALTRGHRYHVAYEPRRSDVGLCTNQNSPLVALRKPVRHPRGHWPPRACAHGPGGLKWAEHDCGVVSQAWRRPRKAPCMGGRGALPSYHPCALPAEEECGLMQGRSNPTAAGANDAVPPEPRPHACSFCWRRPTCATWPRAKGVDGQVGRAKGVACDRARARSMPPESDLVPQQHVQPGQG